MTGIRPPDLGLPTRFTDYRPAQIEMIERTMQSHHRFVAHAAPTGIGKSVALVSAALYMGLRTVILTSTKGLQNQYLTDFRDCGLVNCMGRNNFQCVTRPGTTCEEGALCKCHHTIGQQSATSLCPYKSQWATALASPLVCTNYAYWCTGQRFAKALGHVDMLILDEGHDAPNEISNQMTITISERELAMLDASWPVITVSIPCWREWATPYAITAAARAESLYNAQRLDQQSIRIMAAWRNLAAKLSTMAGMRGAWVVEPYVGKRTNADTGYKLQAVWPYTHAEEVLFLGVSKIVIASATLSRKTLQLMGIRSQDVDYYEYPSEFPPERSPVYSIPTVAMNHKSPDEDFRKLVERVDEIIDGRLDRKGVIHGVSYQRARDIANLSRHRGLMITHSTGETKEAVEVFQQAPAPAILVSPSVDTGYDFAFSQCEFQIICKAPYPGMADPVQQVRREQDWLYPAYEMVMTLVQSAGRGMRAATDRCETFLIDDTITKVFDRNINLWPKWFRRLVRKSAVVPLPPPPLADELPNEFSDLVR